MNSTEKIYNKHYVIQLLRYILVELQLSVDIARLNICQEIRDTKTPISQAMKGETREPLAKDAILNYLDIKKIYVSIETIELNTGVPSKKIHSLVLKMEKRKHVKVEMYEQWRVIILPTGTQFLKNGGYTRNEAEPRLTSISKSSWFIGPVCFFLGILVSGLYVNLNKNTTGQPSKQSFRGVIDSTDHHPKTIKKKDT